MNWILEKLKLKNLIICIGLIILGLASRKYQSNFSDTINLYLGDAIWAMMVYFFFRIFAFKTSILKHGFFCLINCYLIEISQLYHSPLIDSLRNTTIGGLVLGFGFLWTDIISYSIGILAAISFDLYLSNQNNLGSTKK
jgi:hypothetical protein